jgi:predicted amidohydrolase
LRASAAPRHLRQKNLDSNGCADLSYRHLCRQRDVGRNLSDVAAIARKAAAGRVQLIVFPECILTGYMFDSGADLEAHAVPADDAEILKIAAWCAEHSITVIVGFCRD